MATGLAFYPLSTPLSKSWFEFHQVCSLIHQRYKEFSSSLGESLVKILTGPKAQSGVSEETGEGGSSEKSPKTLKKRNVIRLLCELYLCGVLKDPTVVLSVMKEVSSLENLSVKEKEKEAAISHVSLVVTFVRHGRPLFGLPLSTLEAEVPISIFLAFSCF